MCMNKTRLYMKGQGHNQSMSNFGLFSIFAQMDRKNVSKKRWRSKRVLLFLPQQKKAASKLNIFGLRYFSKMKRKPAEKNTEKCFPINL